MNEVFISSREKLPIYELDTLWATYGVTPVAVREDRVLLVRDEGLCWLTFDGSVKPMELPTVFTESDELHLAESRVIGTTVGEHDIAITTLDLTSGALKQTIQAITTPNFNLSYCVATLSYVTRIGIVAGAAYVDIFHVDIDGITHAAYGDVSMPEGFEVVSATPWHVVARADLGVAGDRVQIVSVKDGSLLVDVASDQGGTSVCHLADGLTAIVQRQVDGGDSIVFVDKDGKLSASPVAGVIGSVGGDGNVLILSVYDGIDESVVAAFSSGAKITFEELKSSSGKKYIGYGIQGWLVRGAGGIQFETRSASHLIAPARRSIESVTFVGRRSAAGSTSLVLSKGDECRGIVVHLHGGPEAYETDELRLFGLSSLAVEMGWTWLSLNYRGSRAPDASVTKSAWRNWRQTFLEDLHWAIEPYGARPLVIAGWSFGAALALAASRHVQCDGLIIGGTMGSILRHFSSAVAEDPSHEEWFSRRFSLDGVDAEFFSEEIPTRRNVRVLSFHGRNDLHCPYENFSSIRKSWSSAGIAWEHHDLPEGEHFVATMEEARMLRDECLRFLNRLLLR